MLYHSTRGTAPVLGFCDVLLAGLARDGGLYVPQYWPVLQPSVIKTFATLAYGEVAKTVLRPFVAGEIDDADFDAMIDETCSQFRHPAVTPLVQIDASHWLLELFHGPTLAFKDVAMQLIARLMDHVLKQRNARATIIGATSGDTGGAAIEAFKGRQNTDVFILFPESKVSAVQRRQMTTANDTSIHAVAIKGNFDDCQALVKAMFNDHGFRDKFSLSGINSINWARIMAQIVYYFVAASRLGGPERQIGFTVPTGNFGDIFAGYCAKRMGLPISSLVIATNQNDILARALSSGRYEVAGVNASTSPSMDIQVSSNFERLIFEAAGGDGELVRSLMSALLQSGGFTLPAGVLAQFRAGFSAGSTSEAQCAQTIKQTLLRSGYLADPHTAVGLHVAKNFPCADPMVTLATAHPAKFPDAIKAACGVWPELPTWCSGLMTKPEHFDVVSNDLPAVKDYIAKRTRAA